LKPAVEFWYTNSTTDPAAFWTRTAHEWGNTIESFIGDSREVRDAASAAVAAAATTDEKARKLYARAQQIRNLTFEPEKTNAEARSARDKDRKSTRLNSSHLVISYAVFCLKKKKKKNKKRTKK